MAPPTPFKDPVKIPLFQKTFRTFEYKTTGHHRLDTLNLDIGPYGLVSIRQVREDKSWGRWRILDR